jgi:hypothetical protein
MRGSPSLRSSLKSTRKDIFFICIGRDAAARPQLVQRDDEKSTLSGTAMKFDYKELRVDALPLDDGGHCKACAKNLPLCLGG